MTHNLNNGVANKMLLITVRSGMLNNGMLPIKCY